MLARIYQIILLVLLSLLWLGFYMKHMIEHFSGGQWLIACFITFLGLLAVICIEVVVRYDKKQRQSI